MKECKYCRSMYDDNLSVCPNCGGSKVVTAEEKEEEAALHQKEIENRERAVAARELQKKKMFGIIAGVVGVIVFIISVASYNANKPLSNGMTKDEGEAVLAKGIAHYESGDYEAAIECFAQLPNDSEQYEEAQSMIEKSSESYRNSILAKADTYTENREYEIALDMIKNAQKVLPDDTKLQNAYNETYNSYIALTCNNAKTEAKEQADKEDYLSAMKTIETALNKIPSDAELSALYTQYSTNYEDLVIKKADTALKEQGYESSIKIVRDGLNNLPNSSKFEKAISNYETYAPVYLLEDIDYLTKSSYTECTQDVMTDNHGTEYSGHYAFYSTWNGSSIEFETSGKYKTFTGTAFLSYGDRGFTDDVRVKIYSGDGKLLYQTKSLVKGCSPETFSVDITGVSILIIELEASTFTANQGSIYTQSAMLTNAYLTK